MSRLLLALGCISIASAGEAREMRSDPKVLMRLWHEANSACRGGSGDNPATLRACTEREGYGTRLDQLGWCYGKRGEFGYQHRWHRCGRNSQRPSR